MAIIDYTFTDKYNYSYNPDYVEIKDGEFKLKKLIPLNATFFSKFKDSLNANWGNGKLTSQIIGSAVITDNKLDLTGDTLKYVRFNAIKNVQYENGLCINFNLIPNYSNAPISDKAFFSINKFGQVKSNVIMLGQKTNGNLFITLTDVYGNDLINSEYGELPVTISENMNIELNIDFKNNKTYVFINGELFTEPINFKGNIGSYTEELKIGTDYTNALTPDFYMTDFICYQTLQHTNDFNYEDIKISETKYSLNVQELSLKESIITGNVKEFFTSYILNLPDEIKITFLVNNIEKYFNGADWVDSTGYLQSNTYSEIQTEIKNLIDTLCEFKVKFYILSSTGNTTPVINSFSLDTTLISTEDTTRNSFTTLEETILYLKSRMNIENDNLKSFLSLTTFEQEKYLIKAFSDIISLPYKYNVFLFNNLPLDIQKAYKDAQCEQVFYSFNPYSHANDLRDEGILDFSFGEEKIDVDFGSVYTLCAGARKCIGQYIDMNIGIF